MLFCGCCFPSVAIRDCCLQHCQPHVDILAMSAESLLLRNGQILTLSHGKVVTKNWLHVENGLIGSTGCGEPPSHLKGQAMPKTVGEKGIKGLQMLPESRRTCGGLGGADCSARIGRQPPARLSLSGAHAWAVAGSDGL